MNDQTFNTDKLITDSCKGHKSDLKNKKTPSLLASVNPFSQQKKPSNIPEFQFYRLLTYNSTILSGITP